MFAGPSGVPNNGPNLGSPPCDTGGTVGEWRGSSAGARVDCGEGSRREESVELGPRADMRALCTDSVLLCGFVAAKVQVFHGNCGLMLNARSPHLPAIAAHGDDSSARAGRLRQTGSMSEPARKLQLTPVSVPSPGRATAFGETLAMARGKHLLIALRGHPDPDGIASALAQAHIAQRLGVTKTTIGYSHELSHRENRALVKLLNVEMRKIKSVKEVGDVDCLALVDSHELDPDLADTDHCELLTVVDHHRAVVPPKGRFVDLRLDVGATATIFAEYLSELCPLSVDNEEDRRVATALMHGLSTDTDDFALARPMDFRAAAIISEICDRDLLADLTRRAIAANAMDVIARALASLTVRRNFAFAGVGFVSEADRDTIAQAADFLVRREDIDTCIVYGVVGERFIEGSLRTHSASVDPSAWLEQAFGYDDRGKPYGGGRRDKGAFRIPIGFLGRATDRAQLWQLVEHAAKSAMFRMIGDDPTHVVPGERHL
jgi:nanoRNase/pAp phosphatase (c-di-AMP/oligoRNAs hydrolase)